jgi:hypothetical protein
MAKELVDQGRLPVIHVGDNRHISYIFLTHKSLAEGLQLFSSTIGILEKLGISLRIKPRVECNYKYPSSSRDTPYPRNANGHKGEPPYTSSNQK